MRCTVLAVLIAWAALPARADDWPQWRGPRHDGISSETGWLDRWPAEGPRILWKAEVGTGFASFAVSKGRVFTMGNSGDSDTVTCLDADSGRGLWSHAYPADVDPNLFEGGPTATPTVDGDRVYTLGRKGEMFAFEAATGKIAWSKNVQKETGAAIPSWGFSGSPLVQGDLLILNVGEAGLALEKATGRVAWKSGPRESGYSTPLPLRRGDQWLVLLGSAKSYLAVDAKTGQEAWNVRWNTQYGVNAADPVVEGERVFISSGYGKGAALLTLGAAEPAVSWQSKVMKNQMNPCVLLSGHVYGVDGNERDGTQLKCVELATGSERWTQALTGSGSVLAADGKLIVLAGDGELFVAPASPEGFRPTARARILEGKCWTVPVLSNGRIYARNAEGRVVCLDVRRP
ncbi:MAG TPA: PQQ-binding-like beta-propeller repeat protein [Planctomycetota bacterium]|nr:PQQ-binding-like beta-propeller repeat protein [Planctomycetota bacterium]